MKHYDNYPEIREAVAKLCTHFPGEYWRKLDREQAYPTEFVQALTESGYLSLMIPEKYGGSGIAEKNVPKAHSLAISRVASPRLPWILA